MTKYPASIKKHIIKEYLQGKLGCYSLAEKYQVASETTIRRWINAYKAYGIESLQERKKHAIYSGQLKVDALHYMKTEGVSASDVALAFHISSPDLLYGWRKKQALGGDEALFHSKGRPSMKKKKREKKQTREQELEQKVERLEIENAYLKKLRAFQKDPEGFLEKHNQFLSKNSQKTID